MRFLLPFLTANAFDVATGDRKWSVPFGAMNGLPEEVASISLGGPLATAGGLIFIGAAIDPVFRAFATDTGKEVWRSSIPNSARSAPMTFQGPDGKQYVLIAASGHGLPSTKVGDSLIAFALPD